MCRIVTTFLESCIDLDSDSDSSEDWDTEDDTGLFITNYNHKCSSLCCSNLHLVSNKNKVNLRNFLVYVYYQNLASDLKLIFEKCQMSQRPLQTAFSNFENKIEGDIHTHRVIEQSIRFLDHQTT